MAEIKAVCASALTQRSNHKVPMTVNPTLPLTVEIQNLVSRVQLSAPSRELSIVATKLEEAEMWAARHFSTNG